MALAVRFDLAPERALEFFREKGLKTSFAWQDMLHEEHDRAFTVAKMMDLDLLSDVKAHVDRAIAEGRTFREFAQELKPELVRRGWWGKAEMIDPQTGEKKLVQLGSPRRLRTIFDTNLRTAYAAGHWARIQEYARSAPYLMYTAVLDARTRPQHRAWHGTVLPVDHEWWRTHTPPNGWNCRCTVIQLSARDLLKLGKSGPDDPPPSPTREWTNPRTGEVLEVPVGVDPGWGYAPGRSRVGALLDVVRTKAEAAPPELAAPIIAAIVREQLQRWLERPEGNFPVMRLREEAAAAIGAKQRVAVLSAESALKNRDNHPELKPEEYLYLPDIGEAPDLIVKDSPRSVVLIKRIGRLYYAAVKSTETGEENFLVSYRRTNRADVRALVRAGAVVYGEWRE